MYLLYIQRLAENLVQKALVFEIFSFEVDAKMYACKGTVS